MTTDYRLPYLTKQLIAYLGNKRRLLSHLGGVLDLIERVAPVRSFLDPFAGSGVVSRLAKVRGYAVTANDWEPFAFVVTASHLTVDADLGEQCFKEHGGSRALFSRLNNLPQLENGVFARRYSPARTDSPDYRTERLFYTRENAMFLDTVRDEIERLYPGWDLDARRFNEKILLLSSLVYEAATHANTSGVFKAFHKGFGGFGRDALGRILAPMELQPPLLVPGIGSCRATCEDASTFVRRHSSDLCYLDPPYNQHQYGSNYHILNTVVFGDDPPFDDGRTPDGELRSKAGIRTDWRKTRSRYCSRLSAESAFDELFDSIDSRFVVLSYNTEGLCGVEHLYSNMARHGSVRMISQPYIKYRGGKQSISRKVHNQELLFVLDRKAELGATGIETMRRRLAERELMAHLRRPLSVDRVASRFSVVDGAAIFIPAGESPLSIPLELLPLRRALPQSLDPAKLGSLALYKLNASLAECVITDRAEEADALIDVLSNGLPENRRRRAVRQLLNALRKFAYSKYRNEFQLVTARLERQIGSEPIRYPGALEGLTAVRRIASLRFGDDDG